MRTTINLDPDVEAAVRKLRKERGMGLSEAVNELARTGLSRPRTDYVYKTPSRPMGLKMNVDNIGEILELLDEEEA